MSTDSFCMAPWNSIVVQPRGHWNPCCANFGVSVMADDAQQYVASDAVRDLRASFLRGERPASCRICWDHEAHGKRSRRMFHNARHAKDNSGELAADMINGLAVDTSLSGNLRFIELYLSNKCNMRCRMCGPSLSTAWFKDAADPIIQEIKSPQPPAVSSAASVIPHVIELIQSVDASQMINLCLRGGEPMYCDEYTQLLEGILSSDLQRRIILDISTNGSVYDESIVRLMRKFRRIDMGVSIDGPDALNRYVRGTDVPLAKIFENVRSYMRLGADLPWGFTVNNTISAYNVHAVDELQSTLFTGLGDTMASEMQNIVVVQPQYLQLHVLTPDIKRRIAATLRQGTPHGSIIMRYLTETVDEEDWHWPRARFATYTRRLDQLRGEDLLSIAPHLEPLLA